MLTTTFVNGVNYKSYGTTTIINNVGKAKSSFVIIVESDIRPDLVALQKIL